MMNNNKILTVSYGTFSCTLEGFDDSFDTMKAIAEYFRDLAADDRYFGAEPPQPDAEMLAKIAEREVSRRVEAREHEGRILLKAHEEAVAPTKTPAPTQPAVAPAAAAATDALAPAPEPQDIADAEPDAEERVESEPSQALEALATATDETFDAAEEALAPSSYTATSEDVEEAPQDADAAAFFAQGPLLDDLPGEEDEDQADAETEEAAAATEEPVAEEFVAEDVEPQTHVAAGESLAEKLQRIRAVVSRRDDEVVDAVYEEDAEEPGALHGFAAMETLAEETTAQDELPDVVAEAARGIADALAEDDAADEAVAEVDEVSETDDLDSLLRRIEAGYEKDEADDVSPDLAAQAEDEEDDEDDAEDAGNLFAPEESAEDKAGALHARVLKVNRADLEAALESGDLEAYDDDEGYTGAAARNTADAPEAPAMPHEGRDSLPRISDSAEEDVSRLMAEADHQMQEPEGKTRRSAFAHLRAAVAARFADRSMEDADERVEEAAKAYRSDLAEVVKPRRPVAADRSVRPADERPAPLKLVAEQRIDTETAMQRGPVSPRRVAAATDDDLDLDEDTGFAAYAEERGATTLPELLEAAAAYLSYVEGHEQFSRPQLMSRVRQAECDEFSREDGLRSFGQLLRTGKIEKIKGGRFAASEAIGYKPDHRAAG